MRIASLNTHQNEQKLTAFYLSFSDLMVLLAVFFVMLLAMSKIDVGSFEKLKTGVTGNTQGTLVELAEDLRYIAEDDPGIPGVKVHLAKDGVRLDLESVALFQVGSAVLLPNALEPLSPLFDRIKSTAYDVDVEGHTDDVGYYRVVDSEIESNWSLSGRRASSVVHHLLERGFQDGRLRVVGYAANRPIKPYQGKDGEQLEQARSENRRVSLLVR